ncbi:hypothetical protein [Pseudomonas sp. RIT-PI-S]|uniref:hypothetical protein n=1 Tax=Pseudomonas sp. RIT-PI-S TaxID=3035295 RepID=UPI0021DB5BB6|nr:hypothetical protein [Pseudomonas sp. RIT-PI-S]
MSDWNNRFTQLIRQSRPHLWGNWALASHIQPGAVGFVDPSTGAFKLTAQQLPAVSISESPTSSTWKLSSEGVSRRQIDVKGSGSIVDPSTGLRITPEAEMVWSFQNRDSIASEFAIAKEAAVTNLSVLSEQYSWLLAEAQKVGFAQQGRIAQGFGVVTEVIYAASGLNLGANESNSSYTLGGSVKGLHALLGEGGPSASGKGNYAYSRETNSIDKHVWPAKQGENTSAPIPLAFAFASFEGTTVLPAWRNRIKRLAIYLDSKASQVTTYTAKATLRYMVDGKHHQEPTLTITGGLSGSFANIPLAASQVTLEVTFIGLITNETQILAWDLPLAQWPMGQMHVDLVGTWPGRPSAIIRNDLNNR